MRTFDVQGRFLGMPYDWRLPGLGKLLARIWNPGGPLLSPKAYGWGYTLNLAHPGSWLLLGAVLLAVLLFC
jgi:hypothetical protein